MSTHIHPMVVAVALLVIAGCSAAPDPTPTSSATGPLTPSEHSALEIRTVATCLADQGWKVEVTAEGALHSDLPTSQLTAYQNANTRCRDDVLAAHPRPGLDEAALVTLYKHQLFLVDCLKDKGFQPVQQAPSQEQYVSEGLAGRSPEFYAWSAVGNLSSGQLLELEGDCPQDPPGL